MEYKEVNELKIPVLGLGTWHMGGGLRAEPAHDQDYISAIRYALDQDITHIDTAELYGGGHTEELVGQAIKSYDRQQLFITSKVSPHHLSYRGVLKACKSSLKRLHTDYLDLYLIHWPNPLANISRVMRAFDELVSAGKIRCLGVSNFSLKQLQRAQSLTPNPIITNQVEYSLLHQKPAKNLLPYCQKQGILLTAYTPLAHGWLAQVGLSALDDICQRYHKTPVQLALRWLIDQPNVIAIPKASSVAHIDELLGSLGWHLKSPDSQLLRQSLAAAS